MLDSLKESNKYIDSHKAIRSTSKSLYIPQLKESQLQDRECYYFHHTSMFLTMWVYSPICDIHQ